VDLAYLIIGRRDIMIYEYVKETSYKSKTTVTTIIKLNRKFRQKYKKLAIVQENSSLFTETTTVYPAHRNKPVTTKTIHAMNGLYPVETILEKINIVPKKELPDYLKEEIRKLMDELGQKYPEEGILISYDKKEDGIPAWKIFSAINAKLDKEFTGEAGDYNILSAEDAEYANGGLRSRGQLYEMYEKEIKKYARGYFLGRYTRRK
jgi:hypothetical protein